MLRLHMMMVACICAALAVIVTLVVSASNAILTGNCSCNTLALSVGMARPSMLVPGMPQNQDASLHSQRTRGPLQATSRLRGHHADRAARASDAFISPVLTNGPSNQIQQAKEVVYNTRGCKKGLGIVLPPIRPHFTATRNNLDVDTPFSKFFSFPKGGHILEEHMLSSAFGVWPQEECTLYYSSAVQSKKQAAQQHSDPMLTYCQKYGSFFLTRTNMTLCKHLKYVKHSGTLCDLANKLQGEILPSRRFALACNLNYPSVPRHAVLDKGILGANHTGWISAAEAVRVRHSSRLHQPTLALQMRVPDYTAALGHKPASHQSAQNYACLCIHKACMRCDPSIHIYIKVDRLVAFIREQLHGLPVMRGISNVHIMSNDAKLAASIRAGLRASGYTVTISVDPTIRSLMRDYDVAVQSTVFWATQASSIATNIIHARSAEGKLLDSVVFWEGVWKNTTKKM